MNKYKILLEDFKTSAVGTRIYRIQALKDFNDVSAGDLGGYIASELNLSQDGNAWVYGNARVYGNASVYEDARVYGNADRKVKLKKIKVYGIVKFMESINKRR